MAGPSAGRLPAPLPQSALGWQWLDGLFAIAVTLVGAAIRWPWLQLVPRYTDETVEIQFALQIAREGLRPIVSVDTYNGPVFHYLMAAGFALGAGALWPRILAFLFGSLTVGVTYFLAASLAALRFGIGAGDSPGRLLVPRLSGLAAAALLSVAMIPVVVNSHVAWSHATMPFWTALALWAVLEVRRRDSPRALPLAALFLGLAQQSHWSAIFFVLAAVAWLALSRPRWLRTRWPYVSLVVWCLSVANLAVYNVSSRGGSLRMAEPHSTVLSQGLDGTSYRSSVREFGRLAYQTLGSSFVAYRNEPSDPAALRAALRHPGAILYGVLTSAAILFCLRRGGLVAACWLVCAFFFPLVNSRWFNYVLARYISPLLPITFAAIGCLLVAPLVQGRRAAVWRGLAVVSAMLAVILIVHSSLRLQRFYQTELAAGRTNARLWQVVEVAKERATLERPLIVDRDLKAQRLIMGGHVLKALDAMLSADGIPFDKERSSDNPTELIGHDLVIGNAQRDALPPSIRLEPIDLGQAPAATSPGDFWIYRVLAGSEAP